MMDAKKMRIYGFVALAMSFYFSWVKEDVVGSVAGSMTFVILLVGASLKADSEALLKVWRVKP